MRFRRLVVVAAILAVELPQLAEAFTRSRHADTGVCLWWRQRNVNYYINEQCSQDVPLDRCIAAVRAALDQWTAVDCSDINLVYGGTTSRTDVGYDENDRGNNQNLILWVESGWSNDASAIALTTTTFEVNTGVIVDADIEYNGDDFVFTTAESPTSIMDIQNTTAHEGGHMIGLDHTSDRDATMYFTAPQGETKKRDLAQDDKDGTCFVYPQGELTPSCYPNGDECVPCSQNPPSGGSCSAMPAGSAGSLGFMFLMALAVGRARGRKTFSQEGAKDDGSSLDGCVRSARGGRVDRGM